MATRTYQLMETAVGDATFNQATAAGSAILKSNDCPPKVMSILDILQPEEMLNWQFRCVTMLM
jgi:hypothetical protein